MVLQQTLKGIDGDGPEDGVLQCADDQARGTASEEALDAHDNAALVGEMLRHLLAVLIIILTYEALLHIVHIAAHLAFGENHLALHVLHWDKDAGQFGDALGRECAVVPAYLTSHLAGVLVISALRDACVADHILCVFFNQVSGRQGRPSGAPARCRSASCASCRASVFRAACVCGRHHRRSIWPRRPCAPASPSRGR